jgi:hypothetical protein
MRGDEVDAGLRCAPGCAEDLARAGKALCQLPDAGAAGQPEGTHVVAEAVVPFAPAGQEAAEPVAVGADVPRFGDQLDALQQRDPAAVRRERRCRG